MEPKGAEDYRMVAFKKRLQLPDRGPDDAQVGPARMVDIEGRCADCWGPIVGAIDANGSWIGIACRMCGRSVDADEAEQEENRMLREAERNMPRVRVGRGAEYDEKARFVLKILPDMDRERAEFGDRVENAKRKAHQKSRGGPLTRRDFPEGTPGHLYLQACALVSALGVLPRDMSAISLSDFDFENPASDASEPRVDAGGRVQRSVQIPRKQSSIGQLVQRMGTALVAGFAAAFACEVGMKALLLTRLDEAARTHDLLRLYESLPADCRERLQADFGEIVDVMAEYRHAFGKWRYFDSTAGQKAISALVDVDRTWGLGRAARVIVDEGVIAGLQYDIELKYELDVQANPHVDEDGNVTIRRDDVTAATRVALGIGGHEAAIPWDAILSI